jgi:hypothetical protein
MRRVSPALFAYFALACSPAVEAPAMGGDAGIGAASAVDVDSGPRADDGGIIVSPADTGDASDGGQMPRPAGGCTRQEDCAMHLTCRLAAGEPGRCVSVSCNQDLDCRGRDARCDMGSLTCEPDQRPRCVTDRDCAWETTTRCNRILRRCEMKEEGACAGDFWCDRGQRCDRQTRNCVAVDHCSNDLDCVLGQRCESLRCRQHHLGDPCAHDGECPDDALCRDALCATP